MSQDEPKAPGAQIPEGPAMIGAMRRGVVEALLEHQRIGNPVVVWDRQTHQVVEVAPQDIRVAEAEASTLPADRIASAS